MNAARKETKKTLGKFKQKIQKKTRKMQEKEKKISFNARNRQGVSEETDESEKRTYVIR